MPIIQNIEDTQTFKDLKQKSDYHYGYKFGVIFCKITKDENGKEIVLVTKMDWLRKVHKTVTRVVRFTKSGGRKFKYEHSIFAY